MNIPHIGPDVPAVLGVELEQVVAPERLVVQVAVRVVRGELTGEVVLGP